MHRRSSPILGYQGPLRPPLLAGIAAAAGLVGGATPANAADRAPLSAIEIETGACLRGKELRELVGTTLGRATFDESLEVRVVESSGPGAEISFSRDGALLGQRTFRSEGASCLEVQTAVALLVAIGIEANSEPSAALLPEGEATSGSAERRSILASLRSTSLPTALSTSGPRGQRVLPHVAAGFAEGVLPRTTLALSLGLDWRVTEGRPWAMDLRFNALIPAEPVSYEGPLSGIVALETALCFKRADTVTLCGGLVGGVFQWSDPGQTLRSPWIGVSATLEVTSPRWNGIYALGRISPEACFVPRPGLGQFALLGLAGLGFDY